jgi:hypothetical protein
VINSDDGVISGTSGLKSSGGDDGVLNIQNNGTTAVTVASDGDVGIGTTSPTSKLDINGGSAATTLTVQTSGALYSANIDLKSSSTTTIKNDNGVVSISNGDAAGQLRYNMGGTERARITAGGYFKASDNGTYLNSGANYHELRNTLNVPVLIATNTNGSFADDHIQQRADRSANSAYSFLVSYSGGASDIEFRLRGDGNAFADGTWSNNGADYAEFFESANGQALTLGATVVLDGNKVREATEQDPASAVIGVVRPKEPSKASMIIGNTAWNKWANKYLSDDFDRYIMEDHDVVEWTDEEGKSHSYESHNIPEGITVPQDATRKTHDDEGNKFQHYKLNPAWNPDSEYVNRENRPEWNIIGLLGQVKILKGQPVGDRWVKMRDVSDTVEEWFIR